MTVWNLRQDQIPEFWWLVAPWLDRALRPNGENADDIYPSALAGHYQLWIILGNHDPVGGFATRVVVEEGRRVLEVYALAGKGMRTWMGEVNKALEDMRCFVGAKEIRFGTTRRAKRLLAKFGFRSNNNGRKQENV